MTASEALNAAIKEVIGPSLRIHGFRGSGTRWTLMSARGDVAIVNIQRSSGSNQDEVRFIVNLAVVPVPWWSWKGYGDLPMKSPKESHGLWRDRLNPSGPGDPQGVEQWWSVTSSASAAAAVDDVAQQLETEGIPKLSRLLDREQLLNSVRSEDLGHLRGPANSVFFDIALVVLLADEGGGDEMNQALARLSEAENEQAQASALRLRRWLQDRLTG
jgi:hypothetical protein